MLPLTKFEKENLDIVVEMPKKLKKPIKKDQQVGYVKIYYQNNLLFTEKIYSILDVK